MCFHLESFRSVSHSASGPPPTLNVTEINNQLNHQLTLSTGDISVVGMKNICSFKSLSNSEELYFVCFNTSHQR